MKNFRVRMTDISGQRHAIMTQFRRVKKLSAGLKRKVDIVADIMESLEVFCIPYLETHPNIHPYGAVERCLREWREQNPQLSKHRYLYLEEIVRCLLRKDYEDLFWKTDSSGGYRISIEHEALDDELSAELAEQYGTIDCFQPNKIYPNDSDVITLKDDRDLIYQEYISDIYLYRIRDEYLAVIRYLIPVDCVLVDGYQSNILTMKGKPLRPIVISTMDDHVVRYPLLMRDEHAQTLISRINSYAEVVNRFKNQKFDQIKPMMTYYDFRSLIEVDSSFDDLTNKIEVFNALAEIQLTVLANRTGILSSHGVKLDPQYKFRRNHPVWAPLVWDAILGGLLLNWGEIYIDFKWSKKPTRVKYDM